MREEMRSHHGLARLADRQYGVVSNRQLMSLGFSSSAISRASRSGRLHRIHHAVYAVGHRSLPPHGRCLAAVLACGDRALLSHTAAAWLWGLQTRCPTVVTVTSPSDNRSRTGIRVHQSQALAPDDRTTTERIPVTALPRTLFDLAATSPHRDLTRAVDRAKRRGVLDLGAIDALLLRLFGAPGTKSLREAIDLYRKPVFDRARSELLFIDLIEKAGLPVPALNTWVDRWEIDAYWERERFAVEVDGWETHGTRRAFEEDRLRTEEMKLAGIESVRITARRIEREPDQVGARLGRLLELRRSQLPTASHRSPSR
jgi:hypothetical protein